MYRMLGKPDRFSRNLQSNSWPRGFYVSIWREYWELQLEFGQTRATLRLGLTYGEK